MANKREMTSVVNKLDEIEKKTHIHRKRKPRLQK